MYGVQRSTSTPLVAKSSTPTRQDAKTGIFGETLLTLASLRLCAFALNSVAARIPETSSHCRSFRMPLKCCPTAFMDSLSGRPDADC